MLPPGGMAPRDTCLNDQTVRELVCVWPMEYQIHRWKTKKKILQIQPPDNCKNKNSFIRIKPEHIILKEIFKIIYKIMKDLTDDIKTAG